MNNWLLIGLLLVILWSLRQGGTFRQIQENKNKLLVNNVDSGDGRPQMVGEQSGSQEVLVKITPHGYSPRQVIVNPGTQVTWVNLDHCRHTVTSIYDPIRLQSPALGPGESYSILFNRPGKHPYRCRRHPFNQGVIEIRGDPRDYAN